MRGLAILYVLVLHAHVIPIPGTGVVGVTMFFTLSGFLITSLLLEEKAATGHVRLRHFYERRARRLFPALACFAVVMVAAEVICGWGGTEPHSLLWVAMYVGNWVVALGGSIGGFNHTWSLAVEEQFYLVWPILVLLLARRQRLLTLLTVGATTSSILLTLAWWNGGRGFDRVYYGTDTRAAGLMIGCLLALWLRHGPERRAQPLAATAVALATLLSTVSFLSPVQAYVLLPTLAALLTAGLIWLVSGSGYEGWLTWPPLTYIGRRSYALYLWNWHCLYLARALPLPRLWQVVIGLALAWAVTELSWQIVEKRILGTGRGQAIRDAGGEQRARSERRPLSNSLEDPLPESGA